MAVCLPISAHARRGLCPAIRRYVVGAPNAVHFFRPDRRYFGRVFYLSIPKFIRCANDGGLLTNVYRRLRRQPRNVRVFLAPGQCLVVANRDGQVLPGVRVMDPLKEGERCPIKRLGFWPGLARRLFAVFGRWVSFVGSKDCQLQCLAFCPGELYER